MHERGFTAWRDPINLGDDRVGHAEMSVGIVVSPNWQDREIGRGGTKLWITSDIFGGCANLWVAGVEVLG